MVIKVGGGFGNQSYLMVHLSILANLLVQFQYKQRLFLFFMYLNNDKTCLTLLTELDDGRYVNDPATGRNDDRYVIFLQLPDNPDNFCEIKVFRQM